MFAMPVCADNAQLMQLIEILHKKGTLNQEEYQLLRGAALEGAVQSTKAEVTKEEPLAPMSQEPISKESKSAKSKGAESESSAANKTTDGTKLKFSDGLTEFNVGGRLQMDTGFWSDDVRDNANGTELRRARMEFGGKFFQDWKFKLSYDFADNAVEDKSNYVAYDGWSGGTIKAGLYGAPFSLSEATGSLFGIFMEEAMVISAFKVDDRFALGVESGGDNWSTQVALFGEGPGTNSVDDEARGASIRATWAPIIDKTSLLHLGTSVAHQIPDSASEGTKDLDGDKIIGENIKTVRFRSRPEAHVNMGRLVDTGTLYNVDSYTSYGLETAVIKGPFALEGEYIQTLVSGDLDQPDLMFGGYYGSLSWFLTGESRVYKAKSGSFERVKPLKNFDWRQEGKGAWEIAIRYSLLDLSDENIIGGEERNFTLGVNWYLNPALRLMVNYVLVDTNLGEDPQLLQTRIHFDF